MHTVSIQKLAERIDLPVTTYAKKVEISNGFEIFFLIKNKDRAPLDACSHVLEDTIIGFDPQNAVDLSEAFLMLINKVNRQLTELKLKMSLDDTHIFIGAIKGGHIHFSQIGDGVQALLVTSDEINEIGEDMSGDDGLFAFDSSGQITGNETLYLFSHDIFSVVNDTTIHGLGSEVSFDRRGEEMNDIITNSNMFHNGAMVTIGYQQNEGFETPPPKSQWTFAQGSLQERIFSWGKKGINFTGQWYQKGMVYFSSLSERTQGVALIAGIVVCIFLLYSLISGVLSSQQNLSNTDEFVALLDRAEVLTQEATKYTGSPDIFSQYLSQARELIGTVKTEGILLERAIDIEQQILVLEEKTNEVMTVTVTDSNTFSLLPEDFQLVDVFLINDAAYYVGTDKILGPFIPGTTEELQQSLYPNNETALFATSDKTGKILIYMDNRTIFEFYKGTFQTLEVQQTGGWDEASAIASYNTNIYLLDTGGQQIYKHRRVGQGYSGKTLLVQSAPADFGFPARAIDIDGGIYMLKEGSSGEGDSFIQKILTFPEYEERSLTINNLGTNTFNYDAGTTPRPVFIGNNATQLVFLLMNNRVWIFQPNSKNFNDVKALSYQGQINIDDMTIQDVWVEQNGSIFEIYAGDNDKVIKIRFQLGIDGEVEIIEE